MQKIFKVFAVLSGLGVASCSSLWNDGEYEYVAPNDGDVIVDGYIVPSEPIKGDVFTEMPKDAAAVYNKRIPPLDTLIVCRDKQCAPAELSTSREYIFNALAQLVDNNLDATALLCEANAQAHVCINPYLTVPAKVGVTPAYVYMDGVKVVDASMGKGKTSINLALGYNLSYNGQTPTVCKPDKAMLYVKNNNDIVLNGNGFKCDLTSMGTTTIRVLFAIDYIDLDYGYIGGYYSVGLSGPATGGGSGYGMIRLPENSRPLNPKLTANNKVKESVPTLRRPIDKPSSPYVRENAVSNDVSQPVSPYFGGNLQPAAYQVPLNEPEPEYEWMYINN